MPLEVYHAVPDGWHADEIIATHRALGGRFQITGPPATEPGAPAWMPERHAWLQYRATLGRVADGVRAGDPACIELAVRFIELRYIGSYSGYLRERLARALKNAPLTDSQKARLDGHFRALLTEREHTVEFREFLRLWRALLTEEERAEVVEEFGAVAASTRQWLTRGLRPGAPLPPAGASSRSWAAGERGDAQVIASLVIFREAGIVHQSTFPVPGSPATHSSPSGAGGLFDFRYSRSATGCSIAISLSVEGSVLAHAALRAPINRTKRKWKSTPLGAQHTVYYRCFVEEPGAGKLSRELRKRRRRAAASRAQADGGRRGFNLVDRGDARGDEDP